MKIAKIFIFLVFSFVFYVACVNPCNLIKIKQDQEIIKYLKENIKHFQTQNFEECTEDLMKTNHFTALEYLLNEMINNGLKIKEMLNQKINSYSNQLNLLKRKYTYKEIDYKKVSPSFRWAQSKEYILLDIRFSEDQQTNPCGEIEHISFDITNSNMIHFEAYCNSYDPPIKYSSTILLSKNINKLRSMWGLSEGGNYQATLRKVVFEKWDDLYKGGVETPTNFERWVEVENIIDKEEKIFNNHDSLTNLEQQDDGEIFKTHNNKESGKRKKTTGKDSEFHDFLNNSKFTIGGKKQ